MDNQIRIQGFLDSVRQVDEWRVNIEHSKRVCVGRYLNEIQLDVVLKNEKDIDSLVEFLLNSKPCFSK